MLRSLNTLLSSTIQASDGELGQVHDFLFEDRGWKIRYFVVEVGSLFSRRRVLISPAVASQPDWERRLISTNLTVEQVRNSPDVDTDKPVSRQEEIAMGIHYNWPAYWSMEPPMVPVPIEEVAGSKEGNPHLRSFRVVMSYKLSAADGDLGSLDDLIMDDSTWSIRYLAVKTGSWLNGQKILLSVHCVNEIVWSHREVVLAQTRDEL